MKTDYETMNDTILKDRMIMLKGMLGQINLDKSLSDVCAVNMFR